MTSQRQIRFGELIRSLISDCLLKEDFYEVEVPFTTITVSFVKMSKDLKIANVYFMPLGGEFKQSLLDILNYMKVIKITKKLIYLRIIKIINKTITYNLTNLMTIIKIN